MQEKETLLHIAAESRQVQMLAKLLTFPQLSSACLAGNEVGSLDCCSYIVVLSPLTFPLASDLQRRFMPLGTAVRACSIECVELLRTAGHDIRAAVLEVLLLLFVLEEHYTSIKRAAFDYFQGSWNCASCCCRVL